MAHRYAIRREWHDALRRLCNPAEGYGFSRLWGFFLMGFAAAIVFISIPELSGQHFCFLLSSVLVSHSGITSSDQGKEYLLLLLLLGDFEDGI